MEQYTGQLPTIPGYGFLDIEQIFPQYGKYITKDHLSNEYHKWPQISSHDLIKYIENPLMFQRYKYGKYVKGTPTDSMILGTLIDDLLFDPNNTLKKIKLISAEMKTPSSKNQTLFVGSFIDHIREPANNKNVEYCRRKAYTASYNVRSLSQEDIDRKSKDLYEELKPYIRFEIDKQKNPDLNCVPEDTFSKAFEAVKLLHKNYDIQEFLLNNGPKDQVMLGLPFTSTYELDNNRSIDIRGMPDFVRIMPETKTIQIADLKSSYIDMDIFTENWSKEIYKYKYDIQLHFYKKLLLDYVKNAFPDIEDEWTVQLYHIVVTTKYPSTATLISVQLPATTGTKVNAALKMLDNAIRNNYWTIDSAQVNPRWT